MSEQLIPFATARIMYTLAFICGLMIGIGGGALLTITLVYMTKKPQLTKEETWFR